VVAVAVAVASFAVVVVAPWMCLCPPVCCLKEGLTILGGLVRSSGPLCWFCLFC
jgi:hypothetical protein